VELAEKRGLYSETATACFRKAACRPPPCILYDLDLQLQDMDEAGVDLVSPPLEEWSFINEDLAAVQKKYPKRFVGLA
jgi:hypothetical protein